MRTVSLILKTIQCYVMFYILMESLQIKILNVIKFSFNARNSFLVWVVKIRSSRRFFVVSEIKKRNKKLKLN